VLGLPPHVTTCLFDLDGVLTQTAVVHRAAWQETFDDYLRSRSEQTGEAFQPFDPDRDYNDYVDGRPRKDGVRTFLASRGINPEPETVDVLAERKNDVVMRRMRADGVKVFEGSVEYVRRAREAGLRRAVVSASANTQQVLEVTGLGELMETVVDGVVASQENLRGKPAPDTFLAAAQRLGVEPAQAAVFEDAVAGVQAGHAGGFYVVGVDRVGHADDLATHGADVVVGDLSELMDR
jgi:beta-phosphoglucomutase family hydrolase